MRLRKTSRLRWGTSLDSAAAAASEITPRRPAQDSTNVACHPGAGPYKALLVNTGAEATENAVKIARVATGRQGIVAFTHAFHGRTHMALSLTAKANPYKAGFAPRAAEIYRAQYPYLYRNPWGATTEAEVAERSLAALKDQVHTVIGETEVAAFMLEPVAGEGGFIPAPRAFLEGLQAYAKEIGALWIDDEVQSGIGRTGAWWAVDHYGLEPDLVCSAKALSSGFPLSAVVGKAEVMDKLSPGQLGSTFGGNPVSCAAALATLEVIEEEGLLERAQEIGAVVKTITSIAEQTRTVARSRAARSYATRRAARASSEASYATPIERSPRVTSPSSRA